MKPVALVVETAALGAVPLGVEVRALFDTYLKILRSSRRLDLISIECALSSSGKELTGLVRYEYDMAGLKDHFEHSSNCRPFD